MMATLKFICRLCQRTYGTAHVRRVDRINAENLCVRCSAELQAETAPNGIEFIARGKTLPSCIPARFLALRKAG